MMEEMQFITKVLLLKIQQILSIVHDGKGMLESANPKANSASASSSLSKPLLCL